jgi:hypothetical protein
LAVLVSRSKPSTITSTDFSWQLFDFIITFDSEVCYFQWRFVKLTRCQVHWTWGRGWGIMRIIFIVSRYVPFVGLAMTVYCESSPPFVRLYPLLRSRA